MRKVISSLILLACFTVVSAEPKAPISIKTGFISGNDFRSLSREAKRAYAMGLIDGWFVAPFFDAPKEELRWIEHCTTGMTDEQVVAILEKFLRDNPARWQEPMNVLAWVAMKDGCGK